MIPYGRQSILPADIQAVIDVLQSDFLTQGPAIPLFEANVAKHCNVSHAVAVNSATSALHIACLALGVECGDWVWTSPNTFAASANCARYCGAYVDFVDIDPISLNLCPQRLEEKLRSSAAKGKVPKVVVVVHFAGQPADLKRIQALQQTYDFRIIEDASHAIGATYLDSPIGQCVYSDATVFSFHPVKIITTGEGGMVTTHSDMLAKKLRLFRSHGITRETGDLDKNDEGPWFYEQQLLGYNYRITDIQAALGNSQLQRLNEMIDRRHTIADRYDEELSGLPIRLPKRLPDRRSALHLYCIQVESRRRVFESLRQMGIGVNVHYIPVHLHPYYQKFGFREGDFPNCESYYRSAISIPMYSGMTDDEQTKVIESLREVLQ